MTSRCDRNPAQYERNRRFGHLVHVLDRPISGAKLPSVGLWLNASKSESRLITATILNVLLKSSEVELGGSSSPSLLVSANGHRHRIVSSTQPITWWQSIRRESGLHSLLLLQPEFTHLELLSTESSVDDLGTCRGVVLRRAVTILRSIETQPLTGRFVRSVGQSSSALVWRLLRPEAKVLPILLSNSAITSRDQPFPDFVTAKGCYVSQSGQNRWPKT